MKGSTTKDMRSSRNSLNAQADARALTRREALKTFGSAAGLVAACSLFGVSALSLVGCSSTEASSASSASSGLGSSAELLEDMSDGGNWVEGHRFSSSATTQEVASWLESLGFTS